jgi:hypothetical protein
MRAGMDCVYHQNREKTMSKPKITVKAETKLESHVRAWLNSQATEYDSGVEGVLSDLFHGGCSSGYVGHLVYTADCIRFFARYRRDISALLQELIQETGETVGKLFPGNRDCMAWDENDPLAQEDNNRNLLAWFGFEDAARRLADRQGIEV